MDTWPHAKSGTDKNSPRKLQPKDPPDSEDPIWKPDICFVSSRATFEVEIFPTFPSVVVNKVRRRRNSNAFVLNSASRLFKYVCVCVCWPLSEVSHGGSRKGKRTYLKQTEYQVIRDLLEFSQKSTSSRRFKSFHSFVPNLIRTVLN